MSLRVKTTFTISDPRLMAAIKKNADDTTGFNEQIGALALSSAAGRLKDSYVQGDNVHRTNRLFLSLQAETPGDGTEDTIFKVTGLGGVVGSNVPYAAAQNFGADIEPVTGKYLAIPIPLSLKRKQANWQRDVDPMREILTFIPTSDGDAVLVDDKGLLGHGTGVLYRLVRRVSLPAKEFLKWTRDEMDFIQDVIWPKFWDRIKPKG